MQNHDNATEIDPKATYSLYHAWRNGWLGDVKSFATARKYVMEDMVKDKILDATIEGEGTRRSYRLRGENIISYNKALTM